MRMPWAAILAVAIVVEVAADAADFVDMRIGTGRATGSNVLEPCVPHGSAHPSPDSMWPSPHERPKDAKHGFCPPTSGWWPGDKIVGFSQLHAQGTGGTPSYVTLWGQTPWTPETCGADCLSLLPQPSRVEIAGCKTTLVAQSDIRWALEPGLPKEGYRLKVSAAGVEVAYADASARVHALQTLRQLAGDMCRDALVLTCPAELPCCEIEDSPKFPWRGYMLDTSRHFFGTDVIKRALDAMAYHKLNVFHWHLVDRIGWRFPVSAYPALTDACATRTNGARTTAWSRNEQVGKYGPLFHSREDIAEVVAYATARGIEVVPEIDIPGHQGINGQFAFACCQSGLQPEGTNIWDGSTDMCVGNPDAYRFYEKVFDELCEAFPSKVIHIGGDEVGGNDWMRCPRCLKIMRDRGLKSRRELQNVVMHHFADYLAKKGRRAIGWDEIVEGGEMPPQTMVTHFHGGGHLSALAAGYDVVMTSGIFTYFDTEQGIVGDPYDLYQVFNGRLSWKMCYSYDPCAQVPERDRAHVLGVQGCSWTEILCNEKELDWSVYPRLSCLAEIGWSHPAKRDAAAFEPRLSVHRERLVKMGINAAPLGPLMPWPPAIEPKPDKIKLNGFAVVFAPRVSEEAVSWIDDKSIPSGGCAIEISAVPYYKPGKIEVRHSDAAGRELALRVLAQIATPKNTGVLYIPKGMIRYGRKALRVEN